MLERARELKERYPQIKTPFLQELIWYHRINEDQDKELLTLEFLNVCASHADEGRLFDPNLKQVKYRKDIQVRNIIYNFPELEDIFHSSRDESEKWKEIEKILEKKISSFQFNYEYLRERFDSFDTFYNCIRLLQKASLKIHSGKRWTSKFLFPFSFGTVFFDINSKKKLDIDRRFFSRGGEILYLMVSRAKNCHLLKPMILDIFEKAPQNQRWNKLLAILRQSDETKTEHGLGFLSQNAHELFDQLVNDLICILKSNVPHNDIFEHFSSVSAFYFVHYTMTIAINHATYNLLKSGEKKILYPIEILASKSDHVRKLSREIYKINEDLPLEAMKVVFEDYMEPLRNITDKELLLNKLNNDLNYKEESTNIEKIDFPRLKDEIWKQISTKAKDELLHIHRILFKTLGLASVKKTNSYRYLANDNWLKTLVLINVHERMPFNDFITLLYDKYGFVISNKHSRLLTESCSDNDFRKNEDRLFDRLKALGLLENKSDGYAYVVNAYGRQAK